MTQDEKWPAETAERVVVIARLKQGGRDRAAELISAGPPFDPDALGFCFPEFRPYLDQCRFDNCRHLAEPGCAVRAAGQAGRFDADRLVSYERIYEEVSVPVWESGRSREH